jgi:hypothetical protein
MDAMRRLAVTISVLGGLVAASSGWAAQAQAECISSWSTSKYKSYNQVQADVRSRFGNVRILKVALCVQNSGSYFQIVVMNNKGVVRTLRMSAHENSFLPRSGGKAPSSSRQPPPPTPLPAKPPAQAK